MKYKFLRFFLLFFMLYGCVLEQDKSKMWIQRSCCDQDNKLKVDAIKVRTDVIEILFCDFVKSGLITLSSSVYNDFVFELHGDINDKILIFNLNKKPKGLMGNYNFNERLKDGKYILNVTGKGCGSYYFTLENGKIINEETVCIDFCI